MMVMMMLMGILQVLNGLLVFFGGRHASTYYNDVHVLHTETMTWGRPRVGGNEPKGSYPFMSSSHDVMALIAIIYAHTCTAVGHKLFVFAGGVHPITFNDLHLLDTGTIPPST